MRTGNSTRTLGLYQSTCCDREQIFETNDCFSRCPCCEGLCEWELVERLVSFEETMCVVEEAA